MSGQYRHWYAVWVSFMDIFFWKYNRFLNRCVLRHTTVICVLFYSTKKFPHVQCIPSEICIYLFLLLFFHRILLVQDKKAIKEIKYEKKNNGMIETHQQFLLHWLFFLVTEEIAASPTIYIYTYTLEEILHFIQ